MPGEGCELRTALSAVRKLCSSPTVNVLIRSDSPDGIALGGLEKMKELEGDWLFVPAAAVCSRLAFRGVSYDSQKRPVSLDWCGTQVWTINNLNQRRRVLWPPCCSI